MHPLPRPCGGDDSAMHPLPRPCGGDDSATHPLPRLCGGDDSATHPLPRPCGGDDSTMHPLPRLCGGEGRVRGVRVRGPTRRASDWCLVPAGSFRIPSSRRRRHSRQIARSASGLKSQPGNSPRHETSVTRSPASRCRWAISSSVSKWGATVRQGEMMRMCFGMTLPRYGLSLYPKMFNCKSIPS